MFFFYVGDNQRIFLVIWVNVSPRKVSKLVCNDNYFWQFRLQSLTLVGEASSQARQNTVKNPIPLLLAIPNLKNADESYKYTSGSPSCRKTSSKANFCSPLPRQNKRYVLKGFFLSGFLIHHKFRTKTSATSATPRRLQDANSSIILTNF